MNLGLKINVDKTVRDEGEVTEHTPHTPFPVNLKPAVGKNQQRSMVQ